MEEENSKESREKEASNDAHPDDVNNLIRNWNPNEPPISGTDNIEILSDVASVTMINENERHLELITKQKRDAIAQVKNL